MSMATESTTSSSGLAGVMMAGMSAGEAYIIYGKANPADGAPGTQFGDLVTTPGTSGAMRQVLDTTNLAPADGFIIQGDRVGDSFGGSVSGAGDINGDGIDDLIVGAHRGDDGGRDAGEAYIVYGKTGTGGTQFGMEVQTVVDGRTIVRQVLDTSHLAPTEGFIIQGDSGPAGAGIGDRFGTSIAGVGDINGDGIDDLLIGANLRAMMAGRDAGEAYIVYGKLDTDGDGTQFGMEVRVAANGTAIGDGTEPEGSVVRRVLDMTHLTSSDGFIIQGDRAMTTGSASSVSGAGDINGDGIDDLIVGGWGGDDGGGRAGEAYVIYGKAGDRHAIRHGRPARGRRDDDDYGYH